jgi:hypothetical protein
MKDSHAVSAGTDRALETFAAELTAAAYPVALRRGVGAR